MSKVLLFVHKEQWIEICEILIRLSVLYRLTKHRPYITMRNIGGFIMREIVIFMLQLRRGGGNL